MPAPAYHILCADLGLKAYEPAFLATGQVDLSDMGRKVLAVIHGNDPGVGKVPFGFVSDGVEGPICTIRGTQMPGGSFVEWLDDLQAFLELCPIVPNTGAMWHRGFGKVYSSLTAQDVPLALFLGGLKGLMCHGHSLGAPLATYAALEAHAAHLVVFASPKAGDTLLRQVCQTRWNDIASYENPNDPVPKVPITVDKPWRIEDFQQVADFTRLDADLVVPPIASDWASSHDLFSYFRLLVAFG